MTMPQHTGHDDRDEASDRQSFASVDAFLHEIDDRRRRARRSTFVALGVAVAIGGVATLTSLGLVPLSAENAVLSASAVVAGLALGKK